ncbi:MAG TPA: hypothetical protein VIJ39_00585 [Solirubrobacteraceae bacterium]
MNGARLKWGTLLAAITVVAFGLFGAVNATAAEPWWQLSSASTPSDLPPGGTGTIRLVATNLGDGQVEAQANPVTVVDQLPPGLTATAISAGSGSIEEEAEYGSVNCSLTSLSCTYEGALPAYQRLWINITVKVEAGATNGVENEARISGGGAPSVRVKHPVGIGNGPVPFGVENFEMVPEEEGGTPDTQAGSHPFQFTTTVVLNQIATPPYQPTLPKDLHFDLPPGFVGNPTPFPQCSGADFIKRLLYITNGCASDTVIGVVILTLGSSTGGEQFALRVPLFNLEPTVGEPARFGFDVIGNPILLDTEVETGGDYKVRVNVNNITQLEPFLASRVTFWGVPGDPRHDASRGWGCLYGTFFGPCSFQDQPKPPPLLTLPTSCEQPFEPSMTADSWAQPNTLTAPVSYSLKGPLEETLGLDGCNRMPFSASISLAPDSAQGSTPSGLTVGIHVPQEEALNAKGLSPASVKNTTVTLPAGVALNPAGADGLLACSTAQIGLSSPAEQECPSASKVGTVEIHTPLLPNPLVGAAYLATQNENPFGSLVALYLEVYDPVSGVRVKLAGEVKPDPVTGQLVSTFENTPQLPFEDLTLHFFGGSRAPLGTPALCGAYTTTASIEPWSGNAPAQSSSTFDVTSGPNGSPCSDPLPFAPSLTTGSVNLQAGAFTPFTMTMSREDGQQNLDAVQLKMPPGLLGTLTGVKLCQESQANQGTCGEESLIGHTIVSVGLGGNPYTVTGGRVYLTGPYKGAPFGLSIVNPAKAGPFDLGQVVVRAKIEVDPITTALTITTDTTGPYAIPQILDGIPLQIKHVNVSIDRANFTFNPTDCQPTQIGGSLTSSQGSVSALHVPFQVTNCATLGFKPQFAVSTSGKTSRANGASLRVRLSYPKAAFGTQANIAKVKVDLPKQLPSRLSTLQKACTAATFDANPASCPAGSKVGEAKATTPIIPEELHGPAYFVSYGGAKFPELVIVLSGYGVTVQLHGETFIDKAGITSSTFRQIPDVPIGSFELVLPEGSNSALAATANLCTTALKMPTAFTAQNGMVIKQSTSITATGCSKHKAKKTKKKSKKSGKANAHNHKKK